MPLSSAEGVFVEEGHRMGQLMQWPVGCAVQNQSNGTENQGEAARQGAFDSIRV